MSILSNILKSPVIGGMAQQYNANADFRRQQDAEKESADYQFGKNMELADYKFTQSQKQKEEERTFQRGLKESEIKSKEKIAAGTLLADQAKIFNFVDFDLTKHGVFGNDKTGKFFAKMPNLKDMGSNQAKGSALLDTFYKTFEVGGKSYEDVFNNIFNNPSIPQAKKDALGSLFMRNYKQTLQEESYPGTSGSKREYILNAEETARVQNIPFFMERIARHFSKDVTRIQQAIKDREPLSLVGGEVELKVDEKGKSIITLPTFINKDDQGVQIYNKDDEIQIAMHIENRVGRENLPKNLKQRQNQVVQVAKAYHDKALDFNAMDVNGGVVLTGADLSNGVTAIISATKSLKPGQSIDSDPTIAVKITKALKGDSDSEGAKSNILANPAAVAFVIEQGLPRHIRTPRYRISTSQIDENDRMKQIVLGKQFKILDLNTEFGSLQQMKTDASGLIKTLKTANELGNQTYTGVAADLYKFSAGAKDQFRQILTMLPESMQKKFESFIKQNEGRTFADPEVAKIAIADYYATVLSFRLATIVQTPPGGAATSVRISDKDRDALAVAIQQNIRLSIQNNNTLPLEVILRETEQRIEIVRNLMSGDRRKVEAAKLMRNGLYAQQGLYSPIQELLNQLVPGTGDSGTKVLYNRSLADYNKPLTGGDIDANLNNNNATSDMYGGQPPIVAPGISSVSPLNNNPVTSKTTRTY